MSGQIIRGGFEEIVFYTDEGDTHSVGLRVRGDDAAEPSEEIEYFSGGDGNDHVERREWAWDLVLIDRCDIEVVERWQRQGKHVMATGWGPHALFWREPVPIRLEDVSAARGSFGGKRLRMRTRLLKAAVTRARDLIAGAAGEFLVAPHPIAPAGQWQGDIRPPAPLLRIVPQVSGRIRLGFYAANGDFVRSQTFPEAEAGRPVIAVAGENVAAFDILQRGATSEADRPEVYALQENYVVEVLQEGGLIDLLDGLDGYYYPGGQQRWILEQASVAAGEQLRLAPDREDARIRFFGADGEVLGATIVGEEGGLVRAPAATSRLDVIATARRPGLHLTDGDGVEMRIVPAGQPTETTVNAVSPMSGEPIALPAYTDIDVPSPAIEAQDGHYITVEADRPTERDC